MLKFLYLVAASVCENLGCNILGQYGKLFSRYRQPFLLGRRHGGKK